jgi:hypothetical protein
VLSIREYLAGKKGGMTPPEVAAELESHARAALDAVAAMRPVKSKELRLTLGDLEAMSHLGNYYAAKILGATELARGNKPAAVRHLEAALEHWKKYAVVAGKQYKPQLLNRVGYVDLAALTAKVAADIDVAKAY